MNSENQLGTPRNYSAALDGALLSAGGRSMPDLWGILHTNTAMLIQFSARNDSYVVCAACIVNASTVLVAYPPEQIKQLACFLPPFLNALDIDCFANVCLPTGHFDTSARG